MGRAIILGILAALAVGAGACVQNDPAPPPAAVIPTPVEQIELAPEKQKLIWDLEHVTFKIEQYVGRAWAEALLAGESRRLVVHFHEGAEARVLGESPGDWRRTGVLSEWRRDAAQAGTRTVDVAGLVESLAAEVEPLHRVSAARLRVLHLDPAERPGSWDVDLMLAVRGEGKEGGPAELVAEFDARFRFDPDDDLTGRPTIERLEVKSETLRLSEHRLMEETTRIWGLSDLPLTDNWNLEPDQARGHRYQIAVEDYNRDGYPDVAVAGFAGTPLLLRNVEGQRFEDVARTVGLKPPPGNQPKAANALAAWIDYDNDGFPDLLAGHRFYRNVDGRRFEDRSAASGLRLERVPYGAVVADYDMDGWLDLYILYQKKSDPPPRGGVPWVGDTESGGENELWLNRGGAGFRDATAEAGAGGGRRQTFAASTLFYDDDAYPDIYMVNDLGLNVLLRNRGDGTFEDATAAAGTADYSTSMGVTTGDLDDDGRPEIYVANMYSKMGRRILGQVGPDDYPPGLYEQVAGSCAGNTLYSRDAGDATFVERSDEAGVNGVGWAYAPAMVDLDGDGRLDLYATTGYQSFNRGEPDG